MRERFEEIYRTREWGKGSGEGSIPRHTRAYVAFLQQFLRDHRIRSVVDLGCGDWQFSRLIDWTGIHYQGFDLVTSVIACNQRQFARQGIEFHLFSGDFAALPPADLLLAKDVLQHWSNATITAFLPHLTRFPYSLITNCINPKRPTENRDISDGEFRYLDIRLPPFVVPACEQLTFTNHLPNWLKSFRDIRWKKVVLMTKSENLQVRHEN
jgi:SAM-dependent methyltransferase